MLPSLLTELLSLHVRQTRLCLVTVLDVHSTSLVWAIKNKFAKEVLSKVAVKLCAARSPKYSEVLEIDRLVREFDMHPVEQCLELSQAIDDSDQELFNRRFVLAYFRDRGTFILHILLF